MREEGKLGEPSEQGVRHKAEDVYSCLIRHIKANAAFAGAT